MKLNRLIGVVVLLLSIGTTTLNAQFLPPSCPGPGCGEGGGENPDPIIADWPPFGNVADEMKFLSWLYKTGATEYQVDIFDEFGTTTFFTQTTSSTSMKLDLPNIDGLEVGETYVLTIRTTVGTESKFSNLHFFTLTSRADKDAVISSFDDDAVLNSLRNPIDNNCKLTIS